MAFWRNKLERNQYKLDNHPIGLFKLYDIYDKPKDEFLKWLQEQDAIVAQQVCDKCKTSMSLVEDETSTDGYVWKCSSDEHSEERSIRFGSWFQHTPLSMQDSLILLYYWYRELNMRTVNHELRLDPRISLEWYNIFKGMCVDFIAPHSTRIGGPKIAIEVFHCKVWKRKLCTDSKVECYWILFGLERFSSKCFIDFNECKSPRTIAELLQKWVERGTTVYSDLWEDLNLMEDVNSHLSEYDLRLTFRVTDFKSTENTVKGVWTIVTNQFPHAEKSKALFDGYMGEFLYRRILNEAHDGYLHVLKDITRAFKAEPTLDKSA